MIRFNINYDKAIEAIVWIACRLGHADHHKVSKILFYADKLHLNRYARPVTGDCYIAMQYGPVPSGVRDLLTNNTFLGEEILAKIASSFETEKNGLLPIVKARREPDMEYFSQSDVECLNESLQTYGHLSFNELVKLTHDERAWSNAEMNDRIKFEDLLDEREDRSSLIAHLQETGLSVVI